MFGPSRDQKARPTCLAFAASDTHAALRVGWVPLSCEYVFFHAQRRASRLPMEGAILPAMLTALRQDGQPAEADWQYLDTPPTNPALWYPPPGLSPVFRRAGDEEPSHAIDRIIAELDQGVPVVVLMYLSRSFYYVGPDGFIDQAPREAPDFNRRHAVVAVAHGMAAGQRIVLVRNSWGQGWGDNGYGWLTESFLVPRVFGIATLKEDLSVSTHSNAA